MPLSHQQTDGDGRDVIVNDLDTPGSDLTMNTQNVLLGAIGVDEFRYMDMLRLPEAMDASCSLDLSSGIQSRFHQEAVRRRRQRDANATSTEGDHKHSGTRRIVIVSGLELSDLPIPLRRRRRSVEFECLEPVLLALLHNSSMRGRVLREDDRPESGLFAT